MVYQYLDSLAWGLGYLRDPDILRHSQSEENLSPVMTHQHTVWVQLSLLTTRVSSDEVQVKIFRLHFNSVYKVREFVCDALRECNEAYCHE